MSALTRHIPPVEAFGSGPPRLFLLYALARGVLGSLALVIGVASLYGVLQGWTSTNAEGGWGDTEILKQFGLMQAVPALIASVIGISAWSPFGEVERTAASSLPRLRLLHIGLLLALGIGVSWAYLLAWTSRAPEIDPGLVALRNLLGMTGGALLVGRFLDARISWLVPLLLATVAVFRSMSVAIERVWEPPV
ncbi:MAG: hypothetical protein M3457_16410, partial [Chloroflexota bacterium]|nr:hypothetical protein [Chloroflexota bacterium]